MLKRLRKKLPLLQLLLKKRKNIPSCIKRHPRKKLKLRNMKLVQVLKRKRKRKRLKKSSQKVSKRC